MFSFLNRFSIFGAVIFAVAAPPVKVHAVPAFPGAEGHGARTPGGRGGRLIEVTSLADSGPGTLRAALLATGPRIVVFRVGGTITLKDRIKVNAPFMTIAGQTAPGDGVQIRGAGLAIGASDVIVRGLRIRPGDDADGPDPQIRDGLEIWSPNVIVDHCSLSWAVDETASTWFNTVADVTYQWNIFSEGLHASTHPRGAHSKGLLVGDGAKRVSLHHNLFAHQDERSPHMKGATDTEVINNVIYNWGGYGTHFATCHEDYDDRSGPVLSNIIANFYKAGPSSNTTRRPIFVNTSTCALVPSSRIHLKGNVGPGRAENSGDEYAISNVPSEMKSTALAATASAIVAETAQAASERVLACAGAMAPMRDGIDTRTVNEVKNGMGRIIDSQTQVGGWPAFPGGTAPADADHDGMPDAWEQSKGLNPNDAADGNKLAPSGFAWIEEYVNGIFTGPCFASSNAGTGGTGAGGATGGGAMAGAAGTSGGAGGGGRGGGTSGSANATGGAGGMAGIGGTAGAAAKPATGGSTGAGGTGEDEPLDGEGATPGGCSCHVGSRGTNHNTSAWMLLALGAVVGRWARRFGTRAPPREDEMIFTNVMRSTEPGLLGVPPLEATHGRNEAFSVVCRR
ncbi:MAG: MYXO-CTERM sorting domain-containing protein [Deltaproteobacteria bacterium]|nr:MYXO-CTERM sorting domain-containing protein [Deltaproteobacteria bacterium]